jgi:mRNA interferase RelE/StbE
LEIKYSKKFLKELSCVENEIRIKIEKIAFEEMLATSPFQTGYLEKMHGYDNKYKIRVGNFRIGITIDKENDTLYFERAVHRKDIYRV